MASRKPRRASGLSGQVAAVFIVALACLLVAVGLGVDASTAYSAKTGQEAVLEAVRQSSLGMANAVKYSENPGREARDEVVELLSGNGYSGAAEIWYAELPESESGASDRYAGVYVMLANDTPTTFLQLAGRDKLTAKSTAIWTIHPYSTGTVYRPERRHRQPRGDVRGRNRDRAQGNGIQARGRPGRPRQGDPRRIEGKGRIRARG